MLVVFAGQLDSSLQGAHSFKLLMYLPSGQVHVMPLPEPAGVKPLLHAYEHNLSYTPSAQPVCVSVEYNGAFAHV